MQSCQQSREDRFFQRVFRVVGRTCPKSRRSDYSRRIFPAAMFSELATEYREMAEQCFLLAAAAWHLEAKTAWLDLAQKWLLLAQLADKYAAEQSGRKRGRNIRNALLNSCFCRSVPTHGHFIKKAGSSRRGLTDEIPANLATARNSGHMHWLAAWGPTGASE
jgi:hypothetical protein